MRLCKQMVFGHVAHVWTGCQLVKHPVGFGGGFGPSSRPPPLTSCPPKTLDLPVRSFRPQDLLRGELSATKERLQTCGAQTSSPGPEVGEWFLLGMCEGG